MQIPVIKYDLCSGTGPEDPNLTVHAPFKTSAAAQNVLTAVKGEQGKGTLLLAEGADVFVRPRPDVIDLASIPAAIAAGFEVDFARLVIAPEPEGDVGGGE